MYQDILSGTYPPAGSAVETPLGPISDQPILAESPRPSHNLPIQLTSFVGRERELAELRRLLLPSSNGKEARQKPPSEVEPRLITLTGTGGSGKTRIALESAFELVDAYPDGVWLVELAGLSDPELVPREVASVLDLRELPGKPLLESLVAFLKPRLILLLLDNCEHLVEACARLAAALLKACPALRILATSREALRLPGERLYPLSPLAVPVAEQPLAVEELAGYEAVQLFVERARSVSPAFQLSAKNAPAVTQVCARLDGLPLAIELAAARVSLLPVEQIAARLDDRFRLLSSGSRIAPDRQQTLRAALDWSYRLLSTPEQVLFNRLSVFAGGFDLEAAEALMTNAAEGQQFTNYMVVDKDEPALVLDLLSRLADKSLLVVEREEGGRRYHLLETLRLYASEHLEASGEAEATRQGHAEYFRSLAERAEPELRSGRQLGWLERLECEHDNLRVALAWCLSRYQAETGQRLSAALWYFWFVRGYLSEGLRWLEAFLEMKGGTNSARLRVIAGFVFLAQYRYNEYLEQIEILCQEGLELARSQGDKYYEAFNLINFSDYQKYHFPADPRLPDLIAKRLAAVRETQDPWLIAYSQVYMPPAARDLIQRITGSPTQEDGLLFARQTGDRWLIATMLLYNVGSLAIDEGDFPRARLCFDESLALFQALGDRLGMARVFLELGSMAFSQGDYALSYQYLERRLAEEKALDNKTGIVHSMNAVGMVAHRMGDDGKAHALFEESLALSREFDYSMGAAAQLNSLGFLALQQGEIEMAQSCFLESLVLYQEMTYLYLLATNLYGLGKIAALHGQPEQASRWLGAVGPSFDYSDTFMNPPGFDIWVDPTAYTAEITALKAELGQDAFTQAWEAGRHMGLEGAIREVLKTQGTKPQS